MNFTAAMVQRWVSEGLDVVPIEEAAKGDRLIVACQPCEPCGTMPAAHGFHQGQCGCGAYVWISPKAQQVIALRTEGTTLMCFFCAVGHLPGVADA